jgi:hypothetical protein
MLCGCSASLEPSLMRGYSLQLMWKEVLYPVVASARTILLNYVVKLRVLSRIINHEYFSIAFAIINRLALPRALRINLTAKLNKWKY